MVSLTSNYFVVVVVVVVLFVFSLTEARRLSLKNILSVSEEVTEWEEVGVHLSVPPSELESIRTECGGDARKAKLLIFQYWLGNDSHTSWQKLALAFRESGYKRLSLEISNLDSGTEFNVQ